MNNYEESIHGLLNEQLGAKIVLHKARFKRIFKARYLEMLPSLIKYNEEHSVAIDFLKVEVALRNNYDIVIGQTIDEKIKVLGYAKSKLTTGNPEDLFSSQTLRHGDIKFIIDEMEQKKYYKEITHKDDCQTGNFVVIRNKTLNYTNDYEILNHYIDELAEIQLSRFSISMQVKLNTILLADPNDTTIDQLISKLYNGLPYITMGELVEPDELFYHMKNDGLAQNFQELKREYQNKMSELNTMLGMNSLAVEKASGVSDEEAKSNRSFTTSNSNIYLDARNNGLKKLNKRFGTQLEAVYNDEVVSEFSELAREEEEEEKDGEANAKNNDHPI